MRVLAVFAGFALVLVVGVVVFFTLLPEGTRTDCSEVELPSRETWEATDPLEQNLLAGRLSRCSRLDGLTPEEVEDALGEPDDSGTDRAGDLTYLYELSNGTTADGTAERPPDKWEITFDGPGETVGDVLLINT